MLATTASRQATRRSRLQSLRQRQQPPSPPIPTTIASGANVLLTATVPPRRATPWPTPRRNPPELCSFSSNATPFGNPVTVSGVLGSNVTLLNRLPLCPRPRSPTAPIPSPRNINGDANYAASATSPAVTVTVGSSGINVNPACSTRPSLSPTPGQSGSCLITVTGANSFAGAVTLTCGITSAPPSASDPPTCAFGAPGLELHRPKHHHFVLRISNRQRHAHRQHHRRCKNFRRIPRAARAIPIGCSSPNLSPRSLASRSSVSRTQAPRHGSARHGAVRRHVCRNQLHQRQWRWHRKHQPRHHRRHLHHYRNRDPGRRRRAAIAHHDHRAIAQRVRQTYRTALQDVAEEDGAEEDDRDVPILDTPLCP